MRALVILALFGCVLSGHGQDFKQRLLDMRDDGMQTSKLKVTMEIKVYDSPASSIPFFSQSAVVKRDNENYFYRISGTEMLMNQKYLLMIDEVSRQIICSERSVKLERKFVDPLTANLDSILSLYQSPVLVAEADSAIEHYQITLNQASIKTIDLIFHKQKNHLIQIAYGYEDGQRAVIDFTEFNRNPAFTTHEFAETQYILIEKGRIKTAPKYSRFNLSLN